jgi:hypothetical protein
MDIKTGKLDALALHPRQGTSSFQLAGKPLAKKLADFWQWSTSDLVSNATRGVLAEYIVAMALDCDLKGVRNEWQAWDLTMKDGTKIEVKSAAYIQSWAQREFSEISFSVKKSLAWDRDSNLPAKEATRKADFYVFALLAHQDKETIDPLNLDQWRFYVVPTQKLDERKRSQHSIMLKALEELSGGSVGWDELKKKVRS